MRKMTTMSSIIHGNGNGNDRGFQTRPVINYNSQISNSVSVGKGKPVSMAFRSSMTGRIAGLKPGCGACGH